jgi:hypothetical protein
MSSTLSCRFFISEDRKLNNLNLQPSLSPDFAISITIRLSGCNEYRGRFRDDLQKYSVDSGDEKPVEGIISWELS